MSSPFFTTSKGDIKITVEKCGDLRTNTGFVENKNRKEAILIDAPFGAFEKAGSIFSKETKIVAVLFTHWHFDHIGDGHLFKELGAETYSSIPSKELIEDPSSMRSFFATFFSAFFCDTVPFEIDHEVTDKCTIDVCDWARFFCRLVPGHTTGDVAYYMESMNCLFTGDTMFSGCIGRSDFPGGDQELLISGIKEKLFVFPHETLVVPGHGRLTTIGDEIANNRFSSVCRVSKNTEEIV